MGNVTESGRGVFLFVSLGLGAALQVGVDAAAASPKRETNLVQIRMFELGPTPERRPQQQVS